MSTISVSASSERSDVTPRNVVSASSLAVEEPRRPAVALAEPAQEREAVRRVAHGARRDREHALGAERGCLGGIPVEHGMHAGDRGGEELVALVDALAEPRDREPAHDLRDTTVLDVGDEQTGRVRSQVDGSDAHGGG